MQKVAAMHGFRQIADTRSARFNLSDTSRSADGVSGIIWHVSCTHGGRSQAARA